MSPFYGLHDVQVERVFTFSFSTFRFCSWTKWKEIIFPGLLMAAKENKIIKREKKDETTGHTCSPYLLWITRKNCFYSVHIPKISYTHQRTFMVHALINCAQKNTVTILTRLLLIPSFPKKFLYKIQTILYTLCSVLGRPILLL